jgi:predicted lipoprotein with Yx(FWY)xxD motif
MPLAAASGAAVAVLAGMAVAKSFTLDVAAGANVTNQQHVTTKESIAVNSRGFAVYTLSGETVHHLECTTQQCFSFWPPVPAPKGKPSAQPGIHGKLGTLHRMGFTQLTLNGHPLYNFSLDRTKRNATGEGIVSFGGTWHVVTASGGAGAGSHSTSGTTSTGGTTSTTTTSTTTTTTCAYPPYCY